MAFRRRRVLDPGIRERLALQPGERVLTWATLSGGQQTVVATDRTLQVVGAAQGASITIAWHDISRVLWDAEDASMKLERVTDDGGPQVARLAFDADDGRVPETVRERVTSSIVLAQHIALDGGAGVRVVARRVPGESELRWQLHPDAGADLRDPTLRRQAEQALQDVRRALTP